MDKTNARKWIVENSKKQKVPMIFLAIGNILVSVCGVSIALFAKNIIDYALNKQKEEFIKNAIILVIVCILMIGTKLLCQRLVAVVQGKLEIEFKSRIFSKIISKDFQKLNAYHSGELLTRLTSDIQVVSEGVTNLLPTFFSLISKLICSITVIIVLDKTFAFMLLGVGAFALLLSQLFRKAMKETHKNVQQTEGKVRSFLQETLESLLVVKVFDASKKVENEAGNLQKNNYIAKLKKNSISIFAATGIGFFFISGYLYALTWSAYKLYLGVITPGTITAILQLVGQVQTPITMLGGIFPVYFSILASAERLIELEDMQEEDVRNIEDIDIAILYENLRTIELKDISFSYDRDTVLENANLSIKKGDFVAITGISGIGKSTLFKLILGVLSAESGEIYFDSDKKYLSDKKTRKLFSYVPQGNMLFSGTIRDNISFIKVDATEDEIMEAAKIACAESFIKELPNGIDTVVGERGHGLSEGQIQRLAVARAVLSKAPIVLLDEATSALDEQTEAQLLKNIKSIPNTTCIIISHKSAARTVCNKEIRIENKQITTISN